MNLLVIDASVACKWFLPTLGESLAEEALRLLQRYAQGGVRFTEPDLFWTECANTFWKACRQGRWSRTEAEEALRALERRDLSSTPSRELLQEAFSIAATFDRTVYDSVYVALALRSGAQFVTADDKLVNALGARLPVTWLGSL